jgi:hypothetical protein
MKLSKINPFLFDGIIIGSFFVLLVAILGFFLTPNVNYEGSINGTNFFYGATHSLQPDSIPTIINGITAVTSIIIAFSGAVIGLVYREDFKDKLSKIVLLGFLLYFAFPFAFLFTVYYSLMYGAFNFALKWALDALVIALTEFVLSMLVIFSRFDSHKERENPAIGEDI